MLDEADMIERIKSDEFIPVQAYKKLNFVVIKWAYMRPKSRFTS